MCEKSAFLEPDEISGSIDVPQSLEFLPAPGEAPQSLPRLMQDNVGAPRDVAEEERVDSAQADQNVATVLGRRNDCLVIAGQRGERPS